MGAWLEHLWVTDVSELSGSDQFVVIFVAIAGLAGLALGLNWWVNRGR